MTTGAILAAADRLAVVIADENAALKDHDWGRVRRLADDKRQATQDYEGALRSLGEPQALSLADRQHMHEASRRLSALAEENERRLTVVMFAQRRVMAAISEAVVAAGSGVATYGRSGGMRRGRNTTAPLAVSVDCAL